MKKNLKKIITIFVLILLSSCSFSTWNDWVKIDVDWNTLSTWADWVKIDIDWNTLSTWADWVKIDSSWNNINLNWEKIVNNNIIKGDNNINVDFDEEEDNYGVEESEEENFSCEKNYDDLLNKYWKNYSDCYFKKVNVSSCEWENINKWKINMVVIFDDSWSMWASIWNETMLDIAKDKVSDYISDLGNNTNLSFILYWHKWSWKLAWRTESCEWVETIYKFWDNNISSLKNKISNLSPNGYTPISKSLRQAKELIKNQAKENDKNIILLVSDWKETCWGNPVIEAIKISKLKNTYIDVIWFNVKWDTQKQLMDIAKKWNGNYYDVKSRLDFEDTFNKTKNFLDTMSCGASKAAIELNSWAEAIDKYYTCMYRLKEEQIFILTDAKENCKDEIETKLETRYEKYEKKFEPILEQAENILDNFWELIEEVEDKFDD